MIVNEFADMMPHQISVKSSGQRNDYGRPTFGTPRVYSALIDDSTTKVRTSDGEMITVALTAYVWPVPIGSVDGLPVDISPDDEVEILTPKNETRTLTAVERHYDSIDGVGYLHNIVLRFT